MNHHQKIVDHLQKGLQYGQESENSFLMWMSYFRKMIVLPSRKKPHILPRRKKKKDTSYVEYKHYADLKPVGAKIAPVDNKTKKALKKIKYTSSFQEKIAKQLREPLGNCPSQSI